MLKISSFIPRPIIIGLALILLNFISCDANQKSVQLNTKPLSDTASLADKAGDIEAHTNGSPTDFYRQCSDLQVWYGKLQIRISADSSEIYPMGECYDSGSSYQLLWVLKESLAERKGLDPDSLTKIHQEDKRNDYQRFNCFAFVIPVIDPDSLSDYHDMNIKFPNRVFIYKRADNSWQFIRDQNVKDFEEYTRMMFDLVFSLH